jgi:perosamine synthetase
MLEEVMDTTRDRNIMEAYRNIGRPSKNGKYSKLAENKFAELTRSRYAISMCNGTATLHSCLMVLGIGAGDEVITTPLTMSSTTIAIMQAGAVPVFADVNIDTFNIDPVDIERKVTSRTKAVLSVSLYGLQCDSQVISDLCKRFNLFFIEDNAQCSFRTNNQSDMQSYSFQTSKIINTGEGGMVTTNSRDLADKLRQFSNLGYANVSSDTSRISREDIQNPQFDRHVILGYNYRMSELQAACLYNKLIEREKYTAARRYAFECYSEAIKRAESKNVVVQYTDGRHDCWAFAFFIKDSTYEDWMMFRRLFINNGGHPFYAAWKLTYDEPFFAKRYVDRCAVAEYLQQRLIQLSTNMRTKKQANLQFKALYKTIKQYEEYKDQ